MVQGRDVIMISIIFVAGSSEAWLNKKAPFVRCFRESGCMGILLKVALPSPPAPLPRRGEGGAFSLMLKFVIGGTLN
jgi:hypothetical protein